MSFIQRKRMEDHLKECRILSPETVPNESSLYEASGRGTHEYVTRFSVDDTEIDAKLLDIEQNIIALRGVLNEEIRQRHRLITDVGDIRKANVASEKWSMQVNEFVERVDKRLNDETSARMADVRGCHDEIKCIERQYQV